MEDQTHLTLKEKKTKKEPASHPSVKGQTDSWKSGKRKRKEKKKEKWKKNGGEKKEAPYSLPSLCERSETPGALDRHDWESQETPVAQNRPFGFGLHYRFFCWFVCLFVCFIFVYKTLMLHEQRIHNSIS